MIKQPTDNCGRCGCERRFHNPPKSFTSSKFRIGQTGHQVKVLNMTACSSCPHCFCFCIAFVEPFDGQRFLRCLYEAEDHTHINPTVSNTFTVPSMVPPVQSRMDDAPRLDESQIKQPFTRKRSKKNNHKHGGSSLGF